MNDFWSSDDDVALMRYRAEHGMVAGMEGDEHVIHAGNESLLPPWPPEEVRYICAACGTSITNRADVGWRHELGFAATGGCTNPRPDS